MRFLLVGLFAFVTVPLSAITVKPLSFAELVDDSVAVVRGRVVDVRGQWTADRQGIESLVDIDALEYFKGDLGDRVTVRVPGGQAGSFVNIIPGAARFAEGDQVVLFLKATGPSIPIVTGTTQGVFRVVTDSRTGSVLVVPPVLGEAGAPGVLVRGDPHRRPMPVGAFGAAVRSAQVTRGDQR